FSGDQRRHGHQPRLTERFAAAVAGCDLLVMEGVSLGYEPLPDAPPPLSEAEAIAGLAALVTEAPGLVVANLYGMNRERATGLAQACAAAGRTLAMEPVTAALAGLETPAVDLAAARDQPGRHCLVF